MLKRKQIEKKTNGRRKEGKERKRSRRIEIERIRMGRNGTVEYNGGCGGRKPRRCLKSLLLVL